MNNAKLHKLRQKFYRCSDCKCTRHRHQSYSQAGESIIRILLETVQEVHVCLSSYCIPLKAFSN